MKKILILLWATTIALAIAPNSASAAASRDGHLDSSFGQGGKLTLHTSTVWAVDSALLPDGRVIVAGYDRLLAFLPSGRLDRGFGMAGRVHLTPPAGAHFAAFEEVLVDATGRIVVIGICDFSEGSGVHHLIETQERPRQILVQRYTPDGQLDPSFGDGGTVLTDFGLPPARPGLTPHLFYPSAALGAGDKILITGSRKLEQGEEAFIGRLTSDGENDPSFAPGGGVSLQGFRYIGRPVTGDEGGVFVIAGHGFQKRDLLHLEPDALEPTVISDRPLTRAALWNTLVEDSTDRLLFVNQLFGSREGRLENGLAIERLKANGDRDPGFGTEGAATFRIPKLSEIRLAIDNRGRALVAMTLGTYATPYPALSKPASLILMRLRRNGRVDKSFGREGRITIPLGGPNTTGEGLSLDVGGNYALIAGTWCQRVCRTVLNRFVL